MTSDVYSIAIQRIKTSQSRVVTSKEEDNRELDTIARKNPVKALKMLMVRDCCRPESKERIAFCIGRGFNFRIGGTKQHLNVQTYTTIMQMTKAPNEARAREMASNDYFEIIADFSLRDATEFKLRFGG